MVDDDMSLLWVVVSAPTLSGKADVPTIVDKTGVGGGLEKSDSSELEGLGVGADAGIKAAVEEVVDGLIMVASNDVTTTEVLEVVLWLEVALFVVDVVGTEVLEGVLGVESVVVVLDAVGTEMLEVVLRL